MRPAAQLTLANLRIGVGLGIFLQSDPRFKAFHLFVLCARELGPPENSRDGMRSSGAVVKLDNRAVERKESFLTSSAAVALFKGG